MSEKASIDRLVSIEIEERSATIGAWSTSLSCSLTLPELPDLIDCHEPDCQGGLSGRRLALFLYRLHHSGALDRKGSINCSGRRHMGRGMPKRRCHHWFVVRATLLEQPR